MRHLLSAALVFAAASILASECANAQAPASSQKKPSEQKEQAQDASPVPNPVSSTVRTQLTRFGKNMVAAAELMPAEKFSFKPTAEMNSFGHLVLHSAQSNNLLCARISGTEAPESKVTETDGKEKLVAALRASFDFCETALAHVDDSRLWMPTTIFGNRASSRGAALVILSDGWNDHYGAQAIYLRLNGILPPTAQQQPAQPAKP
jgi:uncharacterized damage-inducible protein DinB